MSTEITTPILYGKNKPKYTDTNTKNQAMKFANQNQTNESIMPPPKLRRAKSDQTIHLSELQLAKNEIIELKKSMKRLKYQNKLLTQNSTGQLCQSCQVEAWSNDNDNDDEEENKNTNENENEIENNDDTQSIASKDSSCPLEPKESFDSYTSSETDSTTGRTTPTTFASSTSSISSTEEASVPVQMLTNATMQHMQQMQQMHMQQQHLQYILQHQQMCMAAAAYHQQQQQQQQHHQHQQQHQQQQYHRQYKPHQHQQHQQHRSPHEYQLQQHQPSHQEPQPQLVVGTKFDGVVSNVTEFGIFVDLSLVTETGKLLSHGVSGMVHVSCFNTKERVEDPHDIYEVGDTIRGVYLQGWKPGGRMRLTMVPMESVNKVEEEVTDELGEEP